MSPICGRIRVPGDLIEQVRWTLLIAIEGEQEGDHDTWLTNEASTACLVNRLRPLRRYQTGFVQVDAAVLADLRLALDLLTIAMDCHCEDYEIPEGFRGECPWCEALLVRDRCDYWLDKTPATRRRNAWVGDVTDRIEGDVAHMWAGGLFTRDWKRVDRKAVTS